VFFARYRLAFSRSLSLREILADLPRHHRFAALHELPEGRNVILACILACPILEERPFVFERLRRQPG
jgi:hypothetical protein